MNRGGFFMYLVDSVLLYASVKLQQLLVYIKDTLAGILPVRYRGVQVMYTNLNRWHVVRGRSGFQI